MKIPETAAAARLFDDEKLAEWQQLAVGKWLGWNDDLWFSYQQACYVLDGIAQFGI